MFFFKLSFFRTILRHATSDFFAKISPIFPIFCPTDSFQPPSYFSHILAKYRDFSNFAHIPRQRPIPLSPPLFFILFSFHFLPHFFKFSFFLSSSTHSSRDIPRFHMPFCSSSTTLLVTLYPNVETSTYFSQYSTNPNVKLNSPLIIHLCHGTWMRKTILKSVERVVLPIVVTSPAVINGITHSTQEITHFPSFCAVPNAHACH